MCDRQILARYFCIRNLSIWSLMIGCGFDSHLWLLGLLDALDKNFSISFWFICLYLIHIHLRSPVFIVSSFISLFLTARRSKSMHIVIASFPPLLTPGSNSDGGEVQRLFVSPFHHSWNLHCQMAWAVLPTLHLCFRVCF